MSGNNLIGACRGPLLLITLGVLLAIDQFGTYGFSRTWPVLIIVFGVLKLFEKTGRPTPPSYPPDSYPPSGPGTSYPSGTATPGALV